jgi:hypothetical protein
MILMLPLSGRFEKAKVLGLILHSCDIAHPAKRYKEEAVCDTKNNYEEYKVQKRSCEN